MTDPTYRSALKLAEKELVSLFRQRETVERQIARTRQTVISLRMKIAGDARPGDNFSHFVPQNLTDACRWVLQAASKPLDVPTMRDRIEALAFDIGSSNPLASIHSVVKRLAEQGEVRSAYRVSPEHGYLWFTHAFWWGQLEKLPAGWVIPTEEEFEREWAKDHPQQQRESVRKKRKKKTRN
jgi:hypothetical protein